MFLDNVKEVFKAERHIVPMKPMSAAEFTAFKDWALEKAKQMDCDNTIITGSVSRKQSHPYSDIDLEMYTHAACGVQGFVHWNSRLVSLHIEPMEEMSAEVMDPYYQVWHRSTLSDGFIIKDDSSYIREIARIATSDYDTVKLEKAKRRLSHENKYFAIRSVSAFNNDDISYGLYYFSYYIQNLSIKSYLERNFSAGSEVKLSQTFVELMGRELTSPTEVQRLLAIIDGTSYHSLAVNEYDYGEIHPSSNNLDEIIISLRRILEYRRKMGLSQSFLN